MSYVNPRSGARRLKAQIVPLHALALSEQTVDHALPDGMVVASIVIRLPRLHCIVRRAVLQETTMSRPRILVINPNSNHVVTQGLEDALKPLSLEGGPEIVCETLAEGPYGIEKPGRTSMAWRCRCGGWSKETTTPTAFVIACYSDPGLHVCREGNRPAGIRHCRMCVWTALTRADPFGVIAIGARSIRPPRALPQTDGAAIA